MQSILDEYEKVSTYNRIQRKYPEFRQNMVELIAGLNDLFKVYKPAKQFSLIKDLSDNKFLDLAYEAKADYIITGNKNDFSIAQFEQTKIVTPKEFCELHETSNL